MFLIGLRNVDLILAISFAIDVVRQVNHINPFCQNDKHGLKMRFFFTEKESATIHFLEQVNNSKHCF